MCSLHASGRPDGVFAALDCPADRLLASTAPQLAISPCLVSTHKDLICLADDWGTDAAYHTNQTIAVTLASCPGKKAGLHSQSRASRSAFFALSSCDSAGSGVRCRKRWSLTSLVVGEISMSVLLSSQRSCSASEAAVSRVGCVWTSFALNKPFQTAAL